MKSSRSQVCASVFLVLGLLHPVHAAKPRNGDDVPAAAGRQPVHYAPATVQDYVRSGIAASEDEVVRIVDMTAEEVGRLRSMTPTEAERVVAERTRVVATARQLAESLNQMGREVAAFGYDLRDDELAEQKVWKKFTDPEAMRNGLIKSLRLAGVEAVLRLVGQPLPGFHPIDLSDLLARVPQLRADQSIWLPFAGRMTVAQALLHINDVEARFALLGINLRDELKVVLDADFFDNYLRARKRWFEAHGLGAFEGRLAALGFEGTKSFAQVDAEVNEVVRSLQSPTIERLASLREPAGREIPALEDIPIVSNLPEPVTPRFQELALEARKDWSGLDFGDRSRFATGVTAYAEIRANRDAGMLALLGGGEATAYVADNANVVANAYVDMRVAPVGIDGKVHFASVGLESQEWVIKESLEYRRSGEIFRRDLPKLEYPTTFAVGPVPVFAMAGIKGTVALNYKIGLTLLSISGSIAPTTHVTGYLVAGVGIPSFQGGPYGNLIVLDANAPVEGNALIRFNPSGAPFMRLSLVGTVDFRALDGELGVFLEYPSPGCKHCKDTISGDHVYVPVRRRNRDQAADQGILRVGRIRQQHAHHQLGP